ncbi:hypothetical protein NUACC26_034900 [Scytonema sp. NUACC26]
MSAALLLNVAIAISQFYLRVALHFLRYYEIVLKLFNEKITIYL